MGKILAEPEKDAQRQYDLQKDEHHNDGKPAEKHLLQQPALFLVQQFYDVFLFHGVLLSTRW